MIYNFSSISTYKTHTGIVLSGHCGGSGMVASSGLLGSFIRSLINVLLSTYFHLWKINLLTITKQVGKFMTTLSTRKWKLGRLKRTLSNWKISILPVAVTKKVNYWRNSKGESVFMFITKERHTGECFKFSIALQVHSNTCKLQRSPKLSTCLSMSSGPLAPCWHNMIRSPAPLDYFPMSLSSYPSKPRKVFPK